MWHTRIHADVVTKESYVSSWFHADVPPPPPNTHTDGFSMRKSSNFFMCDLSAWLWKLESAAYAATRLLLWRTYASIADLCSDPPQEEICAPLGLRLIYFLSQFSPWSILSQWIDRVGLQWRYFSKWSVKILFFSSFQKTQIQEKSSSRTAVDTVLLSLFRKKMAQVSHRFQCLFLVFCLMILESWYLVLYCQFSVWCFFISLP